MTRILYFQSTESNPERLPELARECLSFTPQVSLIQQRHLYLEISQTAGLFKGEENLLRAFREKSRSFEGQWVVCDSGAWAPCFLNGSEKILPVGESKRALWDLPIDRLQYCGNPDTWEKEENRREKLIFILKKVGLTKIGAFARLTPEVVVQKFGKVGAILFQWLHNARAWVLPTFAFVDKIRESMDTDEIGSLEALLFYLRSLLVQIELRLFQRAELAKEISLTLSLDSGNKIGHKLVLLDPTYDAKSVLKLLRDFLKSADWDSPLQHLEIEVSGTVPYEKGQLSLFESTVNLSHELSVFVFRLQKQFGENKVGFANLVENYLPEQAFDYRWESPQKMSRKRQHVTRPFLLFLKKRVFVPRYYAVTPVESVENQWWKETLPSSRYYFCAEKNGEPPLWVYWDRTENRWYAQGSYE